MHHRAGDHQADDLADVLDGVDGKHRLVVHKGGQQRVARNVARQDHVTYTGHGQRGAGIDAQQPAVCHAGENRRRVQGAADLGNVIDIGGGTGYLRTGAFMRVRATGCAVDGLARRGGRLDRWD